MAKIDKGFTLSPWQKVVKSHPATIKSIRAGRRAGKSKLGLDWILDGAQIPDTKNWIVAPTARQGKDIFWHDLINIVSTAKTDEGKSIVKSKNAQLCDIVLINNAQIGIRGTNVEDNLRGSGLDRLFCDEYAYHKPLVWEKILRPQLIDRKGSVIFSSSPKGNNHFKRMEEYIAKQAIIDPKMYATFHYTIYDNPYLDRVYIDKEKSGCSDEVWRQEYLAEYIDWVGTVYHECDFRIHVFDPQTIHGDYKLYPYVKAMDWGMRDNTACIWLHAKDNKILVSDEYLKNNSDPATHFKMISSKDMGRCDQGKHNVMDKTAFRKESSGKTVPQQFMELGIRPLIPSSGSIDYGTNVVKRLFTTGQLLICTHCQNIIQSIHEWEYGEHEPDSLAAMRYGVVYMVERGLITIDDGKGIVIPGHGHPALRPNQVQRIRTQNEEGWNYDDGCIE